MNLASLVLLTTAGVLVAAVSGARRRAPGYVVHLRHFYNDDYTGTYYRTLRSPNDLESKSKEVFRYFVKSHKSVFTHDDVKAYFAEWTKVFSTSGPFDTDRALRELFSTLKDPKDFLTALQMEQLLVNRDDSKDATATFREAFVSPHNVKIEQYYLGDGDVMHGVMVAAVRDNNMAVFVVLLMD